MSKSEHKIRFAERLQQVTREKNISQADISRVLGKYSSEISRWFNAEVIPRPNNIQNLVDIIGCNYEWLATGEGDIFPNKQEKKSPGLSQQLTLTGNGSIQAGGKITGIQREAAKEQPLLDKDEEELILLIRDFGGKRMIRKFITELLDLQKIIDGE